MEEIVYKCINCGFEKKSEKPCGCPECGNKMFPAPYDRETVLVSEIRSFFKGYQVSAIYGSDLISLEYDKDTRRFPDYCTIVDYVTGAKSTELFFDRLAHFISVLIFPFQQEVDAFRCICRFCRFKKGAFIFLREDFFVFRK